MKTLSKNDIENPRRRKRNLHRLEGTVAVGCKLPKALFLTEPVHVALVLSVLQFFHHLGYDKATILVDAYDLYDIVGLSGDSLR